jgi:hypothetical protein
MKHKLPYIVLLLMLAAGLTACSSNEDSDDKNVSMYKDIILEYEELAGAREL